jgi:hypothetical protein
MTGNSISVDRRLALLTDRDARLVLNRIIGGLLPKEPELARPDELKTALVEVSRGAPTKIEPKTDNAIPDQPAAIRLLLVAFADDDKLKPNLVAALAMDRGVLVEPVTAALIMAGIVLLLQTNVDLKIKKKNGKTSIDFSVKKKPTADKIIEKFFGIFR